MPPLLTPVPGLTAIVLAGRSSETSRSAVAVAQKSLAAAVAAVDGAAAVVAAASSHHPRALGSPLH